MIPRVPCHAYKHPSGSRAPWAPAAGAPGLHNIRSRLHEQIKHALLAQILPELLHTDRKFEQIKHTLVEQIRPELLHTDREFEQLKEVLFAHVNAA